ncbi:Hypothetical predicted protein [Cloeon dipterum]|uniref:Rab-GAP TBC domain-containing protein n=1 Tax=Cloeon dipterum TaxID=197152 RepID=A0A8S1DTP9_9INSE|nr:Hypothetical predicted protein [Cloeon dipterum]
MFKLRSRSRAKAGDGDVANKVQEVEPAEDADEDLGLVMKITINNDAEDDSSSLVFKKTHRRQNSRSLPKMDALGLQKELQPSNELKTTIDDPSKEEWFRTWPENKKDGVVNGSPNNRIRATIPLDQLLKAMPLAYSPVTKQLHVLPKVEQSEHEELKKIPKMEEEHQKEEKDCLLSTSDSFSSLSNISREITLNPSFDEDACSTASLRDAFLPIQHKNTAATNDLAKNKQTSAFSNLFSKSIFSWKSSSKESGEWKLFGKKCSNRVSSGLSLDEACSMNSMSGSSSNSSLVFSGREASSGSLILEARPSNLPAKSPEEEERHRQQYQQILEAAKKKELKEAKLKKKQIQEQLRAEDSVAKATAIWKTDILPKWESVKNSKKVRDLWWHGIPSCVRCAVWQLAVTNKLNLTPQDYYTYHSRVQERLLTEKMSSQDSNSVPCPMDAAIKQIKLDISRTFPYLSIFKEGGPNYDSLLNVLAAYVCYEPDLGYMQGMSFIAAVLILNLDPAEAFVCFANILNRPCQQAFFGMNEAAMKAYYNTYNDLLTENMPQLSKHFAQEQLAPDMYFVQWMYTMFSNALHYDIACRVWDLYFRDGEEFLLRAALGKT